MREGKGDRKEKGSVLLEHLIACLSTHLNFEGRE